MRLRKDTTTFVSNPEIVLKDGSFGPLDTSHIYEGELYGEPGTYVHGSIIDGRFAGKIYTPKANYYVEKAELFFNEPQPFHSVIYDERDVHEDALRKKRSSFESSQCGSAREDVRAWMEKVQNSAIDEKTREKRGAEFKEAPLSSRDEHSNLYSSWSQSSTHHLHKRADISPTKRACTLFLQSDTMLWKYMTGQKKTQLGYSSERSYEEITSLFAAHVSGIKKIYETTEFSDYVGFTFVVRRVKVNTTEDCEGVYATNNNYCPENIDVSHFLNFNSLENHNDYCLAYVFTYRDFSGGTLGLAWVGSPTKAAGGICEVHKKYLESGTRIMKSLNTGIVTLLNYNARVPTKVSTLTFAHEVGHNFGSPHDKGGDCVPTGQSSSTSDGGNYIMYASATSGDQANNNQFSSCSITNITLVLDAVLKEANGKKNCFEEPEEAFCGNAIVEQDEICDCGFTENCRNTDQCCFPRDTKNEADKCTLKSNASCSPSQGPCCTTNCTRVPTDDNMICQIETECSEASFCNESSKTAACPTPVPKANLTACNDHTQICMNGECVGSICQKMPDWEHCYISSSDINMDKSDVLNILCYVACRNPQGECISTGDGDKLSEPINKPLKDLLVEFNKENIKLQPGAACDNYLGYCDVFQKCRGVDADGPLARIKNLLFNEKTFNEIQAWIIRYWWAVLLIGICAIVLMGIFIKVCAVHTPSSNPNKPKARKISLRPQANRSRQQRPPPAYIAGPRAGPAPSGRGNVPAASAQPPPYSSYEMKNIAPPPRI